MKKHWTHRYPDRVARGATHPCCKLTLEQRQELYELAERWKPGELARYYGVSRVTIWRYLKAR